MTPVQFGALLFLMLLSFVVVSFFGSGYIDAWIFVNKTVYEAPDACRDTRVQAALLNGPDDDASARIRSFVRDGASLRADSLADATNPLSSRPLIRRVWFWLIVDDEQMAGAYCRLGKPRDLLAVAKIVGIEDVLKLSDQELAALAFVYAHDVAPAKADSELTRIYRERLRAAGGQ